MGAEICYEEKKCCMNKALRCAGIVLLLTGLVLVRKFETVLFYDPFLSYFRGKTGRAYYPEYDFSKIIIHITFRYSLNAVLSLALIWLIFFNRRYVWFSAYTYTALFILLLPVYMYLVLHYFELGDNIGFYIRRFLIQPILLLLLVPALAAYRPGK